MKNYSPPHQRIDEARRDLAMQNTVYDLFDTIPDNINFRKLVGDPSLIFPKKKLKPVAPCISILRDVSLGDKALAEIADTKNPQRVDFNVAKYETEKHVTVLMLAVFEKPEAFVPNPHLNSFGFLEDFINFFKRIAGFADEHCRRFKYGK
jgi:hypothetical protein